MPDPNLKADVHAPRPPTTTHLGRAGEQFVASQLLRLGFNASPLPVDTGVDLLAHWTTATGESRVALFQVKTTARRRTAFRLQRKQLDRLWTDGVNLVCVFWYDAAAPFAVVLPPKLTRMLASEKHRDSRAPVRVTTKGAEFRISSSGERKASVGKRINDVSRMVNRFDRIEATDEGVDHLPPYAMWGDGPAAAFVVLDD